MVGFTNRGGTLKKTKWRLRAENQAQKSNKGKKDEGMKGGDKMVAIV